MRSGVINKKNKIGLSDVENMAIILSKSTKTVTQLKQVFPTLETNLKGSAAFQTTASGTSKSKPASVLLTEEFLRRTPERLENVWKRCKKLTGTLVTLKRLASVQEQRFHPGSSAIVDVNISLSPTPPIEMGRMNNIGTGVGSNQNSQKSTTSSSSIPTSTQGSAILQMSGDRGIKDTKEGTLDDLLDALQNYSNPVKTSSSGNKKIAESNNTSSSTSQLVPSISKDQDTSSPSSQKRSISLSADGGKAFKKGNLGGSFDLQMQPKEPPSPAINHSKNKTSSEDNKPTPYPPPRGPTITKTAPPPPPPRTSSTHPIPSTGAPASHALQSSMESSSNGGHVHGLVRKMSSKINSINNGGKESGGESSDFRYVRYFNNMYTFYNL